jgi:hypothetical protein
MCEAAQLKAESYAVAAPSSPHGEDKENFVLGAFAKL